MCRFCNQYKIFFNRCKLLHHIRSHSFKTATISVNDLLVEPIPLDFYKIKPVKKKCFRPNVIDLTKSSQDNVCFECKQYISVATGKAYKYRAKHFMAYTNEVHSCPVCLFALPTICALRAHLRFHLNRPPFCCPECGIHIQAKNIKYPYGHDCEGFKMMRATTRLKCPAPDCHLYHPHDFRKHMIDNHLKKVYKCPFCTVASFIEAKMNDHLGVHNIAEAKAFVFYQCELCPGKVVEQFSNMDSHLRAHNKAFVFPCWTCGSTFQEISSLIDHHLEHHLTDATIAIKNMLNSVNHKPDHPPVRAIYRVVKRCDHCKRNFTYKCNFNEIQILPSECPFKCLSKLKSNAKAPAKETFITCHLCKEKISQHWKEIKKHYAKEHKMHKCIDPIVVMKKIDTRKYIQKKKIVRNANAKKVISKRHTIAKPKAINPQKVVNPTLPKVAGTCCTICQYTCENKELLETHFVSHKDPCTAYQCMECGQSFVVKPSFATHLKIAHGISDVEEYILNKNRCYNENALEKYQNKDISFEPLKDNQCKICREQFDCSEDLAKHFRGHGMAFLLKSTSNKH